MKIHLLILLSIVVVEITFLKIGSHTNMSLASIFKLDFIYLLQKYWICRTDDNNSIWLLWSCIPVQENDVDVDEGDINSYIDQLKHIITEKNYLLKPGKHWNLVFENYNGRSLNPVSIVKELFKNEESNRVDNNPLFNCHLCNVVCTKRHIILPTRLKNDITNNICMNTMHNKMDPRSRNNFLSRILPRN